MLTAINVFLSVFLWLIFIKPEILANITTTPLSLVLEVTTMAEVIALLAIFMLVTCGMLVVDKLSAAIKRRKTQ